MEAYPCAHEGKVNELKDFRDLCVPVEGEGKSGLKVDLTHRLVSQPRHNYSFATYGVIRSIDVNES